MPYDYDQRRATMRALRQGREKQGLCVYCGQRPRSKQSKACAPCRERINASQRRRDEVRRHAQ